MGADAFRFCFSLGNFLTLCERFSYAKNTRKSYEKREKLKRHENSAKITKKAGAFKIHQIHLENVHAEPLNANSFFRGIFV